MIIETFKYCFHSLFCPHYIKKLGLLSDLIGIESRYSRHKQAWQPHLNNSRCVILETAQGLKKRDQIIIFGAGSLHDVPLEELSKLFTEVHLVDIFFLQSTINEIKKYPNVDFYEVDVTGVLKKAFHTVQDFKAGKLNLEALNRELDSLSTLVPKHFSDDNLDLVVSLNLLSQLPMAIKDYVDDPKFTNFYRSLILNHLKFLKSFAVRGSEVLLISDTEKMVFDQTNKLQAQESSLEELDESIFKDWQPVDQWTWDLAPLGELDSKYGLQLKVQALKSPY